MTYIFKAIAMQKRLLIFTAFWFQETCFLRYRPTPAVHYAIILGEIFVAAEMIGTMPTLISRQHEQISAREDKAS